MPTTFDPVADHIAEAQRELEALTRQLYAGRIDLDEWENAAAGVLKDLHLSASTYARGGVVDMGQREFGRVGGALADEYRFLHGFAGDIQDGKLTEAQALARIDQYGKAGQQAYWREYSQMRNEVWWVLQPGESCGDCMSLAAGSPYKPGQLKQFPGSGATACRGNCNCVLEER